MSLSRQDIEDRLMDYLYEELSDEESAAFEQELRHHPDLQAEVGAHRRTRSAFARLPEVEVPHLVQANILREARKAAAAVGEAREKPRGFFARLAELLMQPAAATAMLAVLVAAIGLYVADRKMLSNEDARDDLYGPERGATISAAEAPSEEADKAVAQGTDRAEGGETSRDQGRRDQEEALAAVAEAPAAEAAADEASTAEAAGVPTEPTAPAAPAAVVAAGRPADLPDNDQNRTRASSSTGEAAGGADRYEGKPKAAPPGDDDGAFDYAKKLPSKAAGGVGKKGAFFDTKSQKDAEAAPTDLITQRQDDRTGAAQTNGLGDDLKLRGGDLAQEVRPVPPPTEGPKHLADTGTLYATDEPTAFPGVAGNIEQRGGGWAAENNAVRDGFMQPAAGAPTEGLKNVAGQTNQKASPTPAGSSGAPDASPEGKAVAADGRYAPQQQQMNERKAAEVVYGGTKSVDSSNAEYRNKLSKTKSSLGGLLGLGAERPEAVAPQVAANDPGPQREAAFESAAVTEEAEKAPAATEPIAEAQQQAVSAKSDEDLRAVEKEELALDVANAALAEGAVTTAAMDGSALMSRGDVLLAEGKTQEAIAAYEKAAKIEPGLAALSRHKVALAYRKANRFLDALVSYDGLLKNYPRYQNRGAALREKFEVSMSLGRLDNAERVLKELEGLESTASVQELRERLFARRVALEAERTGNGSKGAGAAKGHAAPMRAKAAMESMDALEAPAEATKPATVETK